MQRLICAQQLTNDRAGGVEDLSTVAWICILYPCGGVPPSDGTSDGYADSNSHAMSTCLRASSRLDKKVGGCAKPKHASD